MPTDLTREDIAAGVRLERFRLMPGMLCRRENGEGWRAYSQPDGLSWQGEPHGGFCAGALFFPDLVGPDPSDPATAGCLVYLLGDAVASVQRNNAGQWAIVYNIGDGGVDRTPWCPNLGTACFRAALARGRWG